MAPQHRNLRRRKDTGAWYCEIEVKGIRIVIPLGTDYALARRQLPGARLEAKQRAREAIAARAEADGPPITFRRFWREIWNPRTAGKRKGKQVELAGYRLENYADPVIGHLHLEAIDVSHLVSIARMCREGGLSAQTVRHVLAEVRCVLRFAAEKGTIRACPPFGPAMPEVAEAIPRPVPEDHLRILLDGADERVANAMELAAITAIRFTEQKELSPDRIRLDGADPILVIEGTGAKNGKTRVVPLVPRAVELLARAIELNTVSETPSITPYGWMPYAGAAITRTLCRRVGIRHYTWHQLRHTATGRLLDAGLSEETVMAITGHSSVQVLRRYGRRSTAAVRREIGEVHESWAMVGAEKHQRMHQREEETVLRVVET